MSVVEDGHKDRKPSDTVKEVSQGKVNDQDGRAAPEAEEAITVPEHGRILGRECSSDLLESGIGNGNEGEQVGRDPNKHDGHCVCDEEDPVLLDLGRLAS